MGETYTSESQQVMSFPHFTPSHCRNEKDAFIGMLHLNPLGHIIAVVTLFQTIVHKLKLDDYEPTD